MGEDLRAHFPVLRRLAYLNAGTDGPLSRAAAAAADAETARELEDGRSVAHFQRRGELTEQLRAAFARVIGAEARDVALTVSTTQGIQAVLNGLPLGPGDEVVTSDEEHPGLLGPLQALRDLRGVCVRLVPLAEIAGAVGAQTKLIACSQVGWMTGALAPAELAEVDVPVLLDAAQGAGAVPTDVGALGSAALAGPGQKWLCGPDGMGFLHIAPTFQERVAATARAYNSYADPGAGLEATLREDAARFDVPALSAASMASMLAAIELLERVGWPAVTKRAIALAATLAERLRERGRIVEPRGATTLVSWRSEDPLAELEALAAAGVVVRPIPGRPLLRASVGAWNDEDDIERLLRALA